MDSSELDSASSTSARSIRSADRSSKGTGRRSRGTRTSSKSERGQLFLFPMSGLEDSPARTCLWREWGRELGLKGSSLVSFMNFMDCLSKVCPEFLSSKTCRASSLPTEDETSKSLFPLWPNSGMAWDGVCLTAKTSEFPSHVRESSLWDVMEKGAVPPKYFLSPNAAAGILRRADRMGRVLFPPLRKALEILSKGQS